MDWTDTGYFYLVDVNVVSQTNVDNTLGGLSGVVLSGLSVTENYNSDSRVQAKVSTIVKDDESDGYVTNARLRIILSIPDREWHEELITGYVSDISESYDNGYVKRDYTIEGTIWGLLEHKIKSPIIISKGAKMINVWTTLMQTQTRMQYNATNARDKAFSNTIVYEAGSNLSTVLFEVSSGYDRMEVDGHGRVILEKYTAPSSRTPSRIIDYSDIGGLALYPLSKASSVWEMPGRAVVTANVSVKNSKGKTSQQVVVGSYDAPAGHATSIGTRGWLRARTDTYQGTSENPSKSELNAIAEQNWKKAQDKGIVWTGQTVFADYHAGNVLALYTPSDYENGNVDGRKVLVQSVRTNLETFTQELTMKEV